MRNPEKEAKPVKRLCRGVPREENSTGSAEFTTLGVIPVIRWDNKNSDEKIVPAREHSRLTHRALETQKWPALRATDYLAPLNGLKKKENRDAL
jgi:hypothetical protein